MSSPTGSKKSKVNILLRCHSDCSFDVRVIDPTAQADEDERLTSISADVDETTYKLRTFSLQDDTNRKRETASAAPFEINQSNNSTEPKGHSKNSAEPNSQSNNKTEPESQSNNNIGVMSVPMTRITEICSRTQFAVKDAQLAIEDSRFAVREPSVGYSQRQMMMQRATVSENILGSSQASIGFSDRSEPPSGLHGITGEQEDYNVNPNNSCCGGPRGFACQCGTTCGSGNCDLPGVLMTINAGSSECIS